MIVYGLGFLGITLGLAIAAAAGTIGQAKVIEKAIEGVARQPEARGSVMILMIIGLAFIESLVIYCLVISFIVRGDIKEFHQMDLAPTEDVVVEVIE